MPFNIGYNRRRAVAYANRWAYLRNPAYYDFSEIGGDCTNFVSQCLYAGARVMNYTPDTGWYYINSNERSPSWTGVQFLYDFLTQNKTRGPFGREVSLNEVRPGDVIQLENDGKYYHSLFVVKTNSTPDAENTLVNAHSMNASQRPLASYSSDGFRVIHIEGVYL